MLVYLYVGAYVSIRQHTSAYVSFTSMLVYLYVGAYVSIRQHTSAYVSFTSMLVYLYVGVGCSHHTNIDPFLYIPPSIDWVKPDMVLALLTINRRTVRLITFESGDGSLQDPFFPCLLTK
jgi:hypothetical protein